MSQKATFTTKDAAEAAGITVGTFRKRVKALGLEPIGKSETGKRGRPGALWSNGQIKSVKAGK